MVEDVVCNELIDTSTSETLERDFYLWLRGESFSSTPHATSTSPTLTSASTTSTPSLPPIEQLALGFSTISTAPFIKQESDLLFDGFSPSSSMDSDLSPPANQLKQDHFLTAYSTTPLLLCQQHFGMGGVTERYNGMDTPTVFQYDCVAFNSSPNDDSVAFNEDEKKEQPAAAKKPSRIHTAESADNGQGVHSGRNSGTNQLGRQYNPGLPLSMQERQRIVSLYRAGWKICDISKQLCVTHSCVSKILHRYRQTGSVKPKDAKEGRVESPLIKAIRDYRNRLGIFRQAEIREQLIKDGLCRRDNVPSRSSINHILRTKLDVRLKRDKP